MVQDEVTPTTVLSSSVYVVECSVLIGAVSILKLASLKGNVKHFKRLNTMPFVFLCLFHWFEACEISFTYLSLTYSEGMSQTLTA